VRTSILFIAAVLSWLTACIRLPEGQPPTPMVGTSADVGDLTDGALLDGSDGGGEECNGQDDDGDGLIDEALTPPLTLNQEGACAERTQRCDPELGWIHSHQGPGLADLNCDGQDNDCDGAVDEGFVERVTRCGPDECAASGVERCLDGVRIDSCIEGQVRPYENPCDGLDNDCDGDIDEGRETGQCCAPQDEDPPCNGCGSAIFVPSGWVCIPAGTFQMGTPGGHPRRFHPEHPVHAVTISRPILVMTTEVTQGQWSAYFEETPATFGDGDASYPVDSVNWYEALALANAMSASEGYPACYRLDECRGQVGRGGGEYGCRVHTFAGLDCPGYRLPTEAEWEYFARAGTQTGYSHGDSVEMLDQYAWYATSIRGSESGASGTRAVARLTANPWGLFDLHGNLYEWTQDGLLEYSAAAQVDPVHDRGTSRVVRGGCYQSPDYYTRSALRYSLERATTDARPGVRLVRAARVGVGSVP